MTARPVSPGLFEQAGDDALRLVGGYSPTSEKFHFPLQPTCPYSGATDTRRVLLAEGGALWGFTTVTVAPPGYRGSIPYGFGIVELDDPLLVVGRIAEPDPARLEHGMRMRVVPETVYTDDEGTDVVTWAFAPTGNPR